MSTLYEGVKDDRLQLAARHGRRSRAVFGGLLTLTFGLLAWHPGLPSYGQALRMSLAWLCLGLGLGASFRWFERRNWLVRALVGAYLFDALFIVGLGQVLGGAEWASLVGLLAIQVVGVLRLTPRASRWVAWACVGALGLSLVLSDLLPIHGAAPFQSLFAGQAPWLRGVLDLTFMALLSLTALSVSRFGVETGQREAGLRQALGRLRSLNQALSDQQFSLMVSQQDLLLTNERLKQKNEEVLKSQDVIRTLAEALEARDHYTQGHSSRVSEVAVLLARELGLSREEQEIVRHGCLLHDIGKIHVPDAVLRKPGALTDEEFGLMKKHPVIGESICRPLIFARPFLDIIRHHHERWDGRGYPDGLAGEEISLHARIAAIADAWDAMTSDRPYRDALPFPVAFSRLEEGAGTQWDPGLIDQFLRVMFRRVEGHMDEPTVEQEQRS
jgi:putative nucleotidyltransferase with HDIG domain